MLKPPVILVGYVGWRRSGGRESRPARGVDRAAQLFKCELLIRTLDGVAA